MDKQQLNVTLLIPIPEDMVLVKKVEYEELIAQSLTGQYWTMKDLEKRVGKEWRWIKENILYPSRFRKILDVKNGGFVYYPVGRGKSWSFLASKMSRFLEDNFHLIFTGKE
ncbi:DUF771 domain-containing protein [Lysinibacillus xylanilyticus]|uniref:DUF771 domain-containing protein n=1 Tax=Lysinibacillus xylanilyticus TaxID=582475 RepID=A0A2M9QAP2_9BACI|nr:DUF771 domain-containing protein [Lysinibacillus xylanilyticus]PJO45138.1 DUF771 domain-containing protein [Lysinibacillus xylanilyticus]